MRTSTPLAVLALVSFAFGPLLACGSCTESRRAVIEAVGDPERYRPPEAPEAEERARAPEGAPADGASAGGDEAPRIAFEEVARDLKQPTDIQFPPGHADKVVVLEKGGVAWLLQLGGSGRELQAVSRRALFRVDVRTPSEMGLLGIAFHPRFAENGRFFVNYNPKEGALRTHIAAWRVDPKTLADAREEQVLLVVEQPYQNHDGGQLQFGPDGLLYIGLGDGGWRADPLEHGENKGTLLGAMLRIDVDRAEGELPYGIPPDNPFVGEPGARPEVWAYGLRNPWRFSFDERGRVIVADVGQDAWEEVSIAEKGDNLGWDVLEGRHCFEPPKGCDPSGTKLPVWEYPRDEGRSITGGYVYTGTRVPTLAGKYLVADFLTGAMWALTLPEDASSLAKATKLGAWPRLWVTFGRAPDGEVWVADFGEGVLFRIGPAPSAG